MADTSKTYKSLVRLFRALPRHRKRSLIGLAPVAIFTGLSDVLVVAVVSRLFTVLVGQPNRPSIPFTEIIPNDPKIKVIGLIIGFIGLCWISSFSKLFLRSCQFKLKCGIWRDLSEMAQRKILAQPYEFFLGKRKSELSTIVLVNISRVADKMVLPIIQLISGVFAIILLSVAILAIGRMAAFMLISCLVICYITITLIITPFLRFSTRQRITLEKQTNNILNESMRTILDVQLSGSEPYFEKRYSTAGRTAIPFIWKGELLPETPRLLIEPIGITLIFAFGMLPLISINETSEVVKIVPFLATIAVTCLKLTPPLQDSFRALTTLRASLPDLEETLRLIELPSSRLTIRSNQVPSIQGIAPRNNIRIKNLDYQYPGSKSKVLNDINITIPVGGRIAFVGHTGSGKSTTANQLLCLLRPASGSIQLDGIDITDADIPAWQANCAYVPQSITLLNSNIIENVAYGKEPKDIDEASVWEALQAAQLAELVSELPLGLYTEVGDNGIMLSGGQRQRLALARAFYRQARLLVLDEATSALDNKTEAEVMDAIEVIGRRCTLVVIAHRLSTIMRSDCIYEFEKGRIKASGRYDELRETSPSFRDLTYIEQVNKKLI